MTSNAPNFDCRIRTEVADLMYSISLTLPYWLTIVNVIVCESVPTPAEASAYPEYCNVHVPDDLPMFVMKSAAVVVSVTSGAAVPVVGLVARTLRVYFGAARFVLAVIFFNELFDPHSRLVAVFVAGPIKSTPAVTFASAIARLTLPELTATLLIVATVTVAV